MDVVIRRGLGRQAGQHRAEPAALATRACGAGLLVASGAIHLDLYLTSYGHIPTIGPLFCAQAVVAFALGLAIVSTREVVAPLAGALLALATLGGYVLSLLVPLFGFREVRTTAGIAAAVVEIAAAVALGATAARAVRLTWSIAAAGTAVVAAAAALAVSLPLALASAPVASGGVVVAAARLPRYGTVLVSAKGLSLYLLSTETNGRLVCNGACLSIWPPVLVRSGSAPVARSGALAGRLGVVRRPDGSRQVTYNGYPLYLYAGDSRPGQATGQAITSFGGTWYLLRAGARTPAATTVR